MPYPCVYESCVLGHHLCCILSLCLVFFPHLVAFVKCCLGPECLCLSESWWSCGCCCNTASTDTLTTLSCPLELINPILGRNCTRAKALWTGYDYHLSLSPSIVLRQLHWLSAAQAGAGNRDPLVAPTWLFPSSATTWLHNLFYSGCKYPH